MKHLKTYEGNIKSVESKINLLCKCEIASSIDVVDLKLSVNNKKATAAVFLDLKNIENFKDCSHINSVKLEEYKRSRILYFTIEDGREFKLVMSNRFLFAKTTGIYYNNVKVGSLTFKNSLTSENLKDIVVDFLNSTGILISVKELKASLKFNKKELKESFERLAY